MTGHVAKPTTVSRWLGSDYNGGLPVNHFSDRVTFSCDGRSTMKTRFLLAAMACVLLICPAAFAQLTEKDFHTLHKQLKPAADEPWRTIPWKISLLDAQRIAAQQKKPIFIWAMDGHPLGCT